MSLKYDIVPYVDGDGLVAPSLVIPPNSYRTSDNGPLFTAIYYILLQQNGEFGSKEYNEYEATLTTCVGSDKQLHRAPNDTSPDQIDDNLGALAALAQLDIPLPFSLPLALWRFPQLVYAYLLACGVPSLLMLPLAIINSIIIATSCFFSNKNDSSDRQLNWCLIQATSKKSWLAKLAAKTWYWRQSKIYGTNNVMKAVAEIYYPAGHPFISYWKE